MCNIKKEAEYNTVHAIEGYIFNYDIKKDKKIFDLLNAELVGSYIYSAIKKSTKGATIAQINEVVKHITKTKEDFSAQNEYYQALLKFLRIYRLPKDSLRNSEINFENLKNNYKSYVANVNKKIKEIIRSIQIKKKEISKVEGKNNQSLEKNISSDIDILRRYYLEVRKLETYQEMLEFDLKYINGKFDEFCGMFSNAKRNKKIIFDVACEYIREPREDVPSKYTLMQHHLDVGTSHLKHELILFFNIKLQPIYEAIYAQNLPKYMSKEVADESYDINADFSELPSANTLISKKTANIEEYILLLKNLIEKYNVLNSIRDVLDVYPPLHSKKILILRCIDFFENQDYRIFANLVSVQIEALFYDLLIDTNMFDNFRRIELFNNKVLKEKINTLGEEIFVDITEYFSTYFNNLIRNAIAHGRENIPDTPCDQEAFALELLLDLNSLLFLFSRKSEIIKMHRFICSFSNPKTFSDVETMRMEMLFRTLCGDRLCNLNYTVNKYKPIQVVYWLINPTYETIYEKAYDVTLLKKVRALLLNRSFWRFCNDKIDNCINCGYNYLSIGPEFQSCVNLILGCIDNNDAKMELIETNKKLKQLEKKDKNFRKLI